MIERSFNPSQLRTSRSSKRTAQPSPGEVVGYSSVYNSLSENLNGFRERVAPTAFLKSLRENADVRCLINHDPSLIIGRTTNRTLRLSSDSTGLRMACSLPDTSYARDLYASISRGDVNSMSFAFTVDPDGDTMLRQAVASAHKQFIVGRLEA
jgi:HK97 family phage prohead protease